MYDKKRFGVPKIKDVKTKKTFTPFHQVQKTSHGDKDTVLIVPGTYILKAVGKNDGPSFTSDPKEIKSTMIWSFGKEKTGKIKVTFKKKRGSVYISNKNYKNRH